MLVVVIVISKPDTTLPISGVSFDRKTKYLNINDFISFSAAQPPDVFTRVVLQFR